MTGNLWQLVRQDEGGGRYRIGRYTTREEARRVAAALESTGGENKPVYLVQRLGSGSQHPVADSPS